MRKRNLLVVVSIVGIAALFIAGSIFAAGKAPDVIKLQKKAYEKPGEKPKGKDAPKLTKQQELEYHAEAIHENCRGCHKNFNKKTNSKAAPETCAKCHPGKEK